MELAEKGDGGDSILSGDGPGHVSPSSEYINNMPFGMFFSVSPERAQNPSADLTGAEWLSRMDPILTQVTTESPPTTSVCDATLTKHAHVPKATSIPTPACTLAEPSSTPARSASAGSSANTLSLSHCNRVHGSLGQDERESCLMEDDAARNGDFSNPLVTALSLGNTEIASLLIQSGAQVDARDPKGQTALFRAVKRGDRRMACLLLDYGANILAADSSGTQIVHVAVSRNDTEMVRALLEWCRRYDEAESSRPKHLLQQVLNARQETGLTFVHQAVSLQYTDIIKVLLEFGADVNLGCAYGGH